MLVITHYSRLLRELRPDVVSVLRNGRIVASGGPELAEELERTGYAGYEEPADRRPAGPERLEQASAGRAVGGRAGVGDGRVVVGAGVAIGVAVVAGPSGRRGLGRRRPAPPDT